MSEKTTTITLMNKTYKIRCSDNESEVLTHAAQYLNHQMTTLKNQGYKEPLDIAILAALNIAGQAIKTASSQTHVPNQTQTISNELTHDVKSLHEKIKRTLNPNLRKEASFAEEG